MPFSFKIFWQIQYQINPQQLVGKNFLPSNNSGVKTDSSYRTNSKNTYVVGGGAGRGRGVTLYPKPNPQTLPPIMLLTEQSKNWTDIWYREQGQVWGRGRWYIVSLHPQWNVIDMDMGK
eukprot:TRINITY_DN19492_c1_g1_i2.p9 TRINITY_DN19492_c1_g1~~TRINITY_DN19492_c1_g1_i2.p9  ORF type:complete len:119 (+),score=6.19 TRINITY_DN19492_c1_g1_i2:1157-1513(+)